jgi:hypothetical protein
MHMIGIAQFTILSSVVHQKSYRDHQQNIIPCGFFSIVLFPPFPTEFKCVLLHPPKTKSLTLYKMVVTGSVRNVFVTDC